MPLYDSLGESAVEYTVNHSETSIIFAEASKLTFLAKAAKNVKENVKTVVYWGDAPTVKDAAASIEKEVSLLPADDLIYAYLSTEHTLIVHVIGLLHAHPKIYPFRGRYM